MWNTYPGNLDVVLMTFESKSCEYLDLKTAFSWTLDGLSTTLDMVETLISQ
jgi:hypothetical protein